MKMPSYAFIVGEVKKKNPNFDSASDLVISKRLFDFLLKIAVSASDYDEAHYVKSNPDIQTAIAKGVLKSGREHYINTGFKEGRQGSVSVVDEKWYRDTYKDVDQAIKDGKVASASAHHKARGWKENRAANPVEEQDIRSWTQMLKS